MKPVSPVIQERQFRKEHMSYRSNNVSRGIFSALWLSLFVSVAFSQVTTSNTQTLPTFSAQERELKGGETHSYRVALTSGQFL